MPKSLARIMKEHETSILLTIYSSVIVTVEEFSKFLKYAACRLGDPKAKAAQSPTKAPRRHSHGQSATTVTGIGARWGRDPCDIPTALVFGGWDGQHDIKLPTVASDWTNVTSPLTLAASQT